VIGMVGCDPFILLLLAVLFLYAIIVAWLAGFIVGWFYKRCG
jgi:hypothetical protein